jgi:hypothetical protein
MGLSVGISTAGPLGGVPLLRSEPSRGIGEWGTLCVNLALGDVAGEGEGDGERTEWL